MKKHVAVLYGGLSKEREVSLSSGKGVAVALKKLGYKVTLLDVGKNIAQDLKKIKPDVAYNALHGTFGEDGCIQGMLEVSQIPYTHSGVLASALGMDKVMAKKIFAQNGIPVAKGVSLTVKELFKLAKDGKHPLKAPYVVKPVNNGSSVGVVVVMPGQKLNLKRAEWDMNGIAMAEEFVAGQELSVAVLNGKALGAIEIRPKQGFYDYKAKYTAGKSEHIMPADIDKNIYKKVMEYAEIAHNCLGCRGVSRSDFRYDKKKKQLVILEINTHPGMTPLSLTPEIAAYREIKYEQLVEKILLAARLENKI